MNTPISKKTLRSTLLQYRKLLDEEVFKWRNQKACDGLIQFIENGNFHYIHTFLPIKKNREPDISGLFDKMWQGDLQIIVSKTDFQTRNMQHFCLEKETRLKENKLGIPEPEGAERIEISTVDLIVVPLVLADKRGIRLGYGGGFYDQLLKETKALKVGLSVGPPIDDLFQKDEWDVPLNYLITPFKMYRYG